jgi:DNA-directed RNA polymerase alpha subunit
MDVNDIDIKFLSFKNSHQINEIIRNVDDLLENTTRIPVENLNLIPERSDELKTKPIEENVGITYSNNLRKKKIKYLCSIQYYSESEYEKIVDWAYNTSDDILNLKSNKKAHIDEIENEQLEKIKELALWRQNLLH